MGIKLNGFKGIHDLDKKTFYAVCSSCKFIIDDGAIISGKYYCHECEKEREYSK